MSKALDLLRAQHIAYFSTHPMRVDVVAGLETYDGLFDSAPRTKGGKPNEQHSNGPVLTLFIDDAKEIWDTIGRDGTVTVDGTDYTLSQYKADDSTSVWQGVLWLV